MRSRALVGLLSVTGLMLCGQIASGVSYAASAATGEINACSLLSATDIKKATGLDVDEGRRQDAGLQPDGSYSSACVWVIQQDKPVVDDPTAPLRGKSFVILNAMQWPIGSGLARTFLDAFHRAAANGEIGMAPVPRKFGDDALWWGDGLAVRKGDVSFGVSVFIQNVKPQQPGLMEEKLAPHILRHIEQREMTRPQTGV